MKELVIDAFAGGGGASTGIRMALGRDPDIALNHDRFALAMHRANHPATRHMLQDVATVDSVSMCAGLPIGMLWMSPDCTDHSKAKGAAPRREAGRTTRGIGWAIVGWVKALPPWQRPRVVGLENVEEYVDWGPLKADGKRCPVRKGETFKAFVAAWASLGYGKIEWRIRRAWKAGAGTIRRRLYMIMRRDDEPIVWPEPTHGNPNDAEDLARINAGELLPWVTAADSIDFSLPIPSIFDTREEIKRKLGINAKRPLAPKTGARIAKGTARHVIEAAKAGKAFLVKVNHTARPGEARDRATDLPLTAMTGKRDDALVTPFVAYAQQGGAVRAATDPLHTLTASPKDCNVVVAPYVVRVDQNSGDPMRNGVHSAQEPVRTIHTAGSLALISPILVGCGGRAGQSEPRPGDAPVLTQTAKADLCLVAPYLVPRYGEAPGQVPRSRSVDQPGPTPVPDGNEGNLVAVSMMTMRNSSAPTSEATAPMRTLVADGAAETLCAAFLAQHNNDARRIGGVNPGQPADKPLSTLTVTGSQQSLVTVHMLTLRGSDRRDSGAGEPLRTQSAGGTHDALVSLPLLTAYYSGGGTSADAAEPMRTDTAKARFGLVTAEAAIPPFGPEHEARAREVAEFLRAHGCWDGGEFVTVDIGGVTYVIVDICMRMLTPRERYNAQGFPRDYIIDYGIDADGSLVPFSLERQGHMCGNSVCPPEAAALVAANYRPREVQAPRRREAAQASFLEAAE
ncbi:MAG: DNA cytosine methyltransferase [Pseudomonadota bacterium]